MKTIRTLPNEVPATLPALAEFAPDLYRRVSDPMVERLFGPGAAVEVLDVLVALLLRIRDRHGRLVPLVPNAAQRLLARRRGRRNIILKARQLGMTTWIAARFFLSTVLRPGTVTLQVAHTLESAQQIFRIVHRFLRHLPPALAAALVTARANVRELAFAHNDSRYIVETAGNPHAGRGLTIHNLHASEVAMWPGNPRETMAALLAAVPSDGCVEIESTPNGVGGYFYEAWQQAHAPRRASRLSLTPQFFPWWLEPSYRLPLAPGETLEPLTEDEMLLATRVRLEPEQLKFRRHLRKTFGSHAPQEYAESAADCFLISGRPVFDLAAIEPRLRQLFHSRLQPARSSANDALREWLLPQSGRSYIIGVDVAEGGSDGDFSAAEVIDQETGLQCAELLARWPIARFTQELADLGRRYNTALLAVERNNQGLAVLYALEHQFGYPRLFRHADVVPAGKPGWLTNARTKPLAVAALGKMLCDAPEAFLSERLLEQCRSFSYLENGELGALPGAHDDLVMAMAIAQAVRKQTAAPHLGEVAP